MMTNTVAVWFELPALDLDRAQVFYEAVLGHPMKRETMGAGDMAIFQPPGAEVKGALVKGPMFRPTTDGALVYLNAGPDLAVPLGKVAAAGGTVVMPKTDISPFGFIAIITDSEGNRVGLHSLS
jgi:uncharacterized protein